MQSYPTWPNLAAMMFALARTWPERPMLRAWRHDTNAGGGWYSINWGAFGRMAASCARNLRLAGVSAGDRVVLCMENRPEFPIAETALMAIRAVPVPAYTTNTVEDQAHLLRDSGARAAIVSTAALADRLRSAAAKADGLDLLFVIDDDRGRWRELIEDQLPPDDVEAEAASVPATALACLIYTSGTGGTPRGVMLPHRSVLSNCQGAFDLIRPLRLKNEIYLSFLPLSHAYEHTVGQFFLLTLGTEVVYARGVEHLAADLLTVRPTILTAVPRVLEVIRMRVLSQVARETPLRQRLFRMAMTIGSKRLDQEKLTLMENLLDPILDR
ncbi:MAG TPA: AMP-binding protein, partial [Rhodopila sp.]